MNPSSPIPEIVRDWGLTVKALREDLRIEGSPERTLFRCVFEDERGRLFILEEVPAEILRHKYQIIQALDDLKNKGLPAIQPYLPSTGGDPIVTSQERFWQLVPYTLGIELPRPDYVQDAWRGEALADFLLQLRQASVQIPIFDPGKPFFLNAYIHDFLKRMHQHHPQYAADLSPFVAFLEQTFFQAEQRLPVVFCHGDFHPLNIVWGERDIRAVIDWEFLGWKSELYDLANLIGCVGMEDPEALWGGLVLSSLQRFRSSGAVRDESWRNFLDLVIALRFPWFSEWLRKKDEEMVLLELDYLRLLVDNAEVIRKGWGLTYD